MSIAKITLTGQETYLSRTGRSLFDYLSMPSGIDKDTLVDNIMMECGEFEVLYSDPEFMRSSIGVWSSKHYRTFDKWITALNIEYNPLENYDRFEDWKDTGTEDTKSSTEDTNNTRSSTTTDLNGSSENSGENEDKVSAYDSSSYQESEKHDSTAKEKHEDTTKTDGSIDNTAKSDNTGHKDDSSVHVGRIHGNIGVTTSQQMLQSEIDIARFNIINEITNLFMRELCVCVYE